MLNIPMPDEDSGMTQEREDWEDMEDDIEVLRAPITPVMTFHDAKDAWPSDLQWSLETHHSLLQL